MKYEMIFGDEKLFDGAPDGAEMVGGLLDRCRLFYKIVGGDLYASFGKHDDFTRELTTKAKDIKVAAMRRIIQEPKRWTAEDQKAGRLPEVGAEFKTSIGKRKCVITEGKFIFTVYDGSVEVFTIDSAMPLETPKEKAERLRSEWINKAYVDFHRLGCELEVLQKEQIKQIYDALLSRELTMPGKVDE